MKLAEKIYARLPVWAQHAGFSAYGLYWNRVRFGGPYRKFVAEYKERDRYDAAAWDAWRTNRLRALLGMAAERVPYYRDTWTSAEKQAARTGVLDSLPLLPKDPVRADARRFLRDDVHPRWPMTHHTSGSTGTPIASMWTFDEYRHALAIREVRSAGWAGVSFTMPRATFHGRIIVPDANSAGPYHRYNAVEGQVYLSAFHVRRETAAQYVAALRRHRVQWLTGYAVSFYLLAQYILDQNLEVPALRAVITTSEKVTPDMRATMERAYRCKVYEEYSTVENALFASECEHGRLHVSPDAGVVELLRSDGTPAAPGEPGEVVATCLFREYQPMIRYRLGDVASWDDRVCPCGRAMPVLREVLGRTEDVVIGPDGRRIAQWYGVFTNQPNVRQGQIIQETLTRLRVKLVVTPSYGPQDQADIAARVAQRLGPGTELVFEVVDAIPRTKAGKYRAVISLLPKQDAIGQTFSDIS